MRSDRVVAVKFEHGQSNNGSGEHRVVLMVNLAAHCVRFASANRLSRSSFRALDRVIKLTAISSTSKDMTSSDRRRRTSIKMQQVREQK